MTNRIRRYERVWDERPAPTAGLPDGFTLYSSASLSAAQQASAAARRSLYQWAYDRARAEADRRFEDEWLS